MQALPKNVAQQVQVPRNILRLVRPTTGRYAGHSKIKAKTQTPGDQWHEIGKSLAVSGTLFPHVLPSTSTAPSDASRKVPSPKMTATAPWKQTLLLLTSLLSLSTAHSTPHRRWRSSLAPSLDFGSCPNPGITWDYDLDGSGQFGFAPTDQDEFPHGFSSDVSTLEVYICNRLESICNASPPAIEACHVAFELYSGLAGQNAADSWNEALSLYVSMPSQTQTGYETTTTAVATVLVSGSSVPYSTLFSAVSSVYSESLRSSVFSSYTSPTYTIFSTQTVSDNPIATSSSPTTTSTSTIVLPVSVSSSTDSQSTRIIVPTGGTTVTTTTSYASTATPQPPQSTTIGSGDGGGSPFSGEARVLEPLRGVLVACFVVPAILMLVA